MAATQITSRNRYRPQAQPAQDNGDAGYSTESAYAPPQEGGQYRANADIPLPDAPPPTGPAPTNKYQGGFTNVSDPEDQARQNRMNIQGTGDALMTNAANAGAGYAANESGYQDAANAAYRNLAQTPGYTPQESSQINVDYGQNRTSQGDLGQRQLTDTERAQIAGNPDAAKSYFNPALMSGLTQQGNEGAASAVNAEQEGLGGVVQTAQGAGLSGDYQRNLGGTLATQKGEMQGAISPLEGKQLSDADVQQMKTAAGASAGNRYRSAVGDMERSAAASGETSPMAVADMRERMERESAAASGEAENEADIASRNAQYSRMADLSGRKLGAATEIGQQTQGALTNQEGMRQSGQEFMTQAQMDAVKTGGKAGIDQANANINRTLGVEGENQQTGIGLAQTAEQKASDRSAGLAANRQGTTADIQNTGYQQGMQTAGATSQGAQTVGNARQAGEQKYRDFTTGEQGMAQSGRQAAAGQQQQAYGTQTSGTNQAAGTSVANVTAQKAPSTAQQVGMGLVNALFADGGTVTKPTVGMVGEDGPEWVGPSGQLPGDNPSAMQAIRDGMADTVKNRFNGSPAGQMVSAIRNRYGSGGGGDSGTASEAAPDAMAAGRIVTKPTMALLGEHGPESVIPLTHRNDARVPPIMMNQAKRMAAIHASESRNRYRPSMAI